jgi:hypothetical protein
MLARARSSLLCAASLSPPADNGAVGQRRATFLHAATRVLVSQCRGMMIPISGHRKRPIALPLQPELGLPPLTFFFQLTVSRSTCPPRDVLHCPPPPPANSFVIGTAVINTHTPKCLLLQVRTRIPQAEKQTPESSRRASRWPKAWRVSLTFPKWILTACFESPSHFIMRAISQARRTVCMRLCLRGKAARRASQTLIAPCC